MNSTINANRFRDRRVSQPGAPSMERRQFSNSYSELSPEAQDLARAIDAYKSQHCRKFINYEEMLSVLHALGYRKLPTER